MKINFDDKFLQLLKEKNEKEITITLKGNPSCKGFEYNPVLGIYPPSPEKKENYSLIEVEGIKVYVDKEIENENLEKLFLRFTRFGMTENYFADIE